MSKQYPQRGSGVLVAANDASAEAKSWASYLCDGTADDVEIQAAITALPAGGGIVRLSEGTFNIAATVTIDALTQLRGAGVGITTLKRAVGLTTTVISATSIDGAVITDLTIDCASTASIDGLTLDRTRLVDCPSLSLINCAGTALVLKAGAAGNNTGRNHFGNIFLSDVATGLSVAGYDASHVVTLNFFDSILMNNVSVAGIDITQWADDNYWSNVWIDLTTNNAKGVIHNSAGGAADTGVYSNQFGRLAIDSFGITGAVGIEFQKTKQNIVSSFFHSPNAFNGTLLSDVHADSYYIVNACIDVTGTGIEVLSKNTEFRNPITTDTYESLTGVGVGVSNGANANVSISTAGFVRLTGPTGAFSISGFTGGVGGRQLTVFHNIAQQLTITNDATSTAANRILTLTGADVVLAASSGSALTFIYSSGLTRWILVSAR